MILTFTPEATRLLASPDHKPVRDLLTQLIGASLDDTLTHLLFSSPPPTDQEQAVLKAEARILLGLRKIFADASLAAAAKATPPAGASGNSPGGFV